MSLERVLVEAVDAYLRRFDMADCNWSWLTDDNAAHLRAALAAQPATERIEEATRLLKRAQAVVGRCIPADHNGYDGDEAKATWDAIEAFAARAALDKAEGK